MAIQSVTGFDLAAHRQFCDDVDYLNSIWDWVLEEYPDNHIAAYGGRIVAVSKTQGGILAELKRQGIPQNFTVHRYASSKSEIWIL